nr:hypothetical protein HK105_005224 [Polyrhizophydium stewartii]
MADMMVREIRATVEGPIQLIRFGSCGGIGTRSQVGLIAVAKDGAASVTRNNDFFAPMYAGNAPDESLSPYVISEACPADKEISEALVDALRKRIGDDSVITGMNATADSFYSSQGRLDPGFNDYNQDLIEAIRKRHPNCETLEMESFTLLHLARCASFVSKENSIRAAACAMIFADRKANDFIAPETVERLENDAGLAVLDALVACPF